MALPNLTRDQAAERAALVTVDTYRIVLDLTDGDGAPGERTFRSTTTVEFGALAGADTVIDIAADAIHSATLNGVDDRRLRRTTSPPASRSSAWPSTTSSSSRPTACYSNTGEGLHRFVDPVDDEVYLYSQFETADAKRMFACFDQPDLKATFDVTRHRARALAGDLQRRHGVRRAVRQRVRAHLRDHAADEHLPGRPHRRARTRAGTTCTPTSTARSRSASSAAGRSRSSWTPSGCSPRPSRASGSITRTSACHTLSASTTSCSCPSSTRAPWRTPAR